MPKRALISVVMAVFRPDPVYFPQAVKSVLDQTYEELELVIVEDPSDQSAADLLSQFSDPRIRHYCNQSRTGLVAQRNQTLNQARGELVAVLDADDICYPDRIQKQVAFLQRHEDVDVLGSQLEIIDTIGQCIGWRDYPTEHEAMFRAMSRYNPIAQPSVMFRNDRVLKAGGYTYDKYPAVEDYELWSRLVRAGTRIANHQEPLLKYRVHAGGMKTGRLRGSLRGTLEVKETHWGDRMNWRDRLRVCMERTLLCLPPRLVLELFLRTQYQSRCPVFEKQDPAE